MMTTTPIKELMTTKVKTLPPNALMMRAKEIFDTNSFHHIPVLDEDEKLLGILSLHDYNMMLTTFSIFKNSKSEIHNRRFMMSTMAKDVMTEQVVKLHTDDPISSALRIFKENLFHAIPVVDDDNRVVGILSTYDLLNYAYKKPKLLNV